MNLYLLTQNENTGYDTYDSCIVVAETSKKAKQIHPRSDTDSYNEEQYQGKWWESIEDYNWALTTWVKPQYVQAVFLGKAKRGAESGVILASFNAG